jgi:hypothetical protein
MAENEDHEVGTRPENTQAAPLALTRAAPDPLPLHDPDRLLDELSKEYYAVVGIVSAFDQRLMTIKGWSVTISLAALGFGFSRGHYALFGVAAIPGAVFWIIDVLTKRHQLRYYPRMRDIEVAAFKLNNVEISKDKFLSAPRVDWTWSLPERPERKPEEDQRHPQPEERPQETLKEMLHGVPWMGNVMLPHVVAIALGILLCIGVAIDIPAGMHELKL